jgi:hypothetical protein
MKLSKVTCLLILLACLSNSNAQSNIEYGELAELNGVTKIYVDTGTDLSGRENIINVIRKELSNVVVVSRIEEAEAVLIYSSDSYRILNSIVQSRQSSTNGTVSVYGNRARYSGQTNSTTMNTPTYKKITDGAGLVLKLTEDGRSRLLMNFKDTKSSILERRPSTNFARKFVKVYKDVNGSALQTTQLAETVSLAQAAFPSSTSFDLNGGWLYNEGPVQIIQKDVNVRVTYASPLACNSTLIADLLEGKINGPVMEGKMTICTNEKLVSSCGFAAVSHIPFSATIQQDRIVVTATIPGMNISYGSDGQCKVSSDNRQTTSYRSTLVRRRE